MKQKLFVSLKKILSAISRITALIFCVALFWNSNVKIVHADPQPGVVRAILFYSPLCGHCEYVILEILPSIFEKYGDELEMIGVDVSAPEGNYLFQAALAYFNLDRGAVPFLIIGDQYLVGSVEIPEKFPGMIDEHLSRGGIDWTPVPEIVQAMSYQQADEPPATEPAQARSTSVTTQEIVTASVEASMETQKPETETFPIIRNPPGIQERFVRDPVGNSVATVVLLGILGSVIAIIVIFFRYPQVTNAKPSKWIVPVICVIGLVVAGYLSYIETTQVEAVCGPVGDCNTVQQSDYARLFGRLPVGVLGLIGYCMMVFTWFLSILDRKDVQIIATLILFVLAIFGTLFSLYLTFLEPFVIGATCAWCLTSAILMTLLLWVTFAPAKVAYSELRISRSNMIDQ